jgi:hypothetical protein
MDPVEGDFGGVPFFCSFDSSMPGTGHAIMQADDTDLFMEAGFLCNSLK